MADHADIAQAQIEADLERRIEAARSNSYTDAASAAFCAFCGGEIPQARREAVPGTKTCLDCARDAERAARMVS